MRGLLQVGRLLRKKGLADNFSKLRRNGVSYKSSDSGEDYFLTFRNEFVIGGERLENGGFPERDGAVLFGMSETTGSEIETLGRHGRRWFVPRHSAVHALKTGTAGFLVAFQFQMVRPGFPSSAGNGMADAFEIDGSKSSTAVHWVFRMGFAGRNGRKGSDGISYRGGKSFGRIGLRKFDLPYPGGHQHEPFSGLWYSVVRTINDIVTDGISEKNKLFLEGFIRFMLNGPGNVFHSHEFGFQFINQTREMKKESPFSGSPNVPSVRIGGEWLAGGASSKKTNGSFGVMDGKILSGNFRDVSFYEFSSAIGFEWIPAGGIHIDTGLD